MVNLMGSLRAFKPIRALVVGDFALDTYITGSVGRISPEAPVPILHVKEKKDIPGMAGNVALNLASLGARVVAVGRLGEDVEGALLQKHLLEQGIETKEMLKEKGFRTPVKTRMIASAQQLLRVDFEEIAPLSPLVETALIQKLSRLIQEVDVVAISDYKKGFLTKELTQELIQEANRQGKVTLVDPKGNDFSKYRGCTLLKPNLQEAYAAAQCERSTKLEEVAKRLLLQSASKYLLITRSEEGMTLFEVSGHREDFKVEAREVKDVTGAGDTVLAMMTMGMGSGLLPATAAQLANVAASLAVQKLGCARVTLSQVAEQLLALDHDHKIFMDEHLYALGQVLEGKTFTVLGLAEDQEMSTELFYTIKRLRGKNPQHRLLISLPKTKQGPLIPLLASLHEVSYIVLSSENLGDLFKTMPPHEVFLGAGDSLQEITDPVQLLQKLRSSQVRS